MVIRLALAKNLIFSYVINKMYYKTPNQKYKEYIEGAA